MWSGLPSASCRPPLLLDTFRNLNWVNIKEKLKETAPRFYDIEFFGGPYIYVTATAAICNAVLITTITSLPPVNKLMVERIFSATKNRA